MLASLYPKSQNTDMNTPEDFADEHILERTVQRTVDQVVIDGEVDGKERRVPYATLAEVAFQWVRVPLEVKISFSHALVKEERFIDRVDRRYGYEPTLSEASQVQPSLRAIVLGRAMIEVHERQRIMARMDTFATAMYQKAARLSGIFTTRELSGILKTAGFERLSIDEFNAFWAYMDQDPRFYLVGDGRVVLKDIYQGDPTAIVEASLLHPNQLTEVLISTLPMIRLDSRGYFSDRTVLGALKAQNIIIRQDQVDQLFEKLRLLPMIESLADGRYKWHQSRSATQEESPREPLSLEAKLKKLRGSMPQNSRGRRR